MWDEPWIILMTDRARLGAPVYAVASARPGPQAGPFRRTMRVENARRFPARRKALFSARRLMDRVRGLLFTVVKVGDGDFRRPRPDRAFVQVPLPLAGVERP